MTDTEKIWAAVGGGHMPKPSREGTAHIDSKLLASAQIDWDGERPADYLFSDFGTFTRNLGDESDEDAMRRLADAHVSLMLFYAMVRPRTQTLVFQDDGGSGGLYVFTEVTDEYIEVSIVSNYGQLEYKEGWYQAVLSLFGWYAYPAGMFSAHVFRKRWPRDFITIYVALQVSEIVVFIFDIMRSGAFRLLINGDENVSMFQDLMPQLVIWPLETDFSFAESSIRLTREVGMVPEPTSNTFFSERRDCEISLVNALEIAEMNDDEVGMTSLSELQRNVRARSAYVEDLRLAIVEVWNQQNASGESEWAEEDEDDDWFDPEDLIDDLIRVGLLDAAGNRSDDATSLSAAQGIMNGSSEHGDDAGAYLVDAGYVSNSVDPSIDATLEQTIEAALTLADEAAILACFAWPGGLVWLTRGRPDCVVPGDAIRRLESELARFNPVVVWERPIPKLESVTSRFGTVTDIVLRLRHEVAMEVVHTLSAAELTEKGADDYIVDCANDDSPLFASMRVQLGVFGEWSPGCRIDVQRDERWAVELPYFLEMNFPCEEPHLFVCDDGWTVRVVDEDRRMSTVELRRTALAVQIVLGGQIRTDGQFRLV